MNQDKLVIFLAAALLCIAAVGYGVRSSEPGSFFYPLKTYFSGEVVYVADLADEINLLEDDLSDIAAQLEDGTLTEAEAQDAYAAVIVRVDRINSIIANAEKGELTPAMRDQLNEALSRLVAILSTYRDSLSSLEEVAGISITVGSDGRPQLNPRSGGGSRGLFNFINRTTETLADHIEEVTGDEIDVDELLDEADGTSSEEETADEVFDEETESVSTEEPASDSTVTPSDSAVPEIQEERVSAIWRQHLLFGLGIAYQYRVDADGHENVLLEPAQEDDESLITTVVLTRKKDSLAMQDQPDSEGPPTINLSVFRNESNLSPFDWADENSRYSNINSTLPSAGADEVVFKGHDAVTYIADGLYNIDTYVIENGQFIYLVTGSYIEKDSQIRKDFIEFLDRLSIQNLSDSPSETGDDATASTTGEQATSTEEGTVSETETEV